MNNPDQDKPQQADGAAERKANDKPHDEAHDEAQGLRRIAELFPQMKKFVGDMVQGMPKPKVPGTPSQPLADDGRPAPEAADSRPADDKPA